MLLPLPYRLAFGQGNSASRAVQTPEQTQRPMSATAQQVAFATGKRRPSGTFLPPAEHVCASGALGRRPPVEPHPFIARCAADVSAASSAPHSSATLQLQSDLRRAHTELDVVRRDDDEQADASNV